MPGEGSPAPGRVRAAEVVGTLCLATDLGMGFPYEHGLHTTVIASRLGRRMGVDRKTGCTTDAHVPIEAAAERCRRCSLITTSSRA